MTRTAGPLQGLLRQGFVALLIKVAAAGLSFLMFLALARALPPEAFGEFGFAFSLAVLLSVAGSFGQRALALKYASIYVGEDNHAALAGLLRFGYGHILAAGAAICAGLALVSTSLGMPYLAMVGPLALALSIAEYQAHVLRAYGTMSLALAPRDVLWRLIVIAAALATGAGLMQMTTAFSALTVLALSLLGLSAGQMLLHAPARGLLSRSAPAAPELRTEWRHAALGLWGTSVIQSAGPNLAVVLLGLILSPAETGPFFSALRVAMVLSLFLMAANMAAASAIARSHAAGDNALLQSICASVARYVSWPTAAGFAVFALFGRQILELFGPGFDSAFAPLLILGAGYLASALMGPTVQIMETTGHERRYLRYLTVTTCAALALLPAAILLAGTLGAALMVSANMVIPRALCYRFILQTHRIAPGLLPRRRGAADHD
ncbi:lipopolysaccharide biosynthesis protein [Roseobacter sinensis]|uniref:Oligosaccharide flippase family protein n=1 Tax=Roseobacter sinensis TaxID=2931391 RepID=A0ABT3BK61_9RHOB|nr:oligosaccharide flippase family protein [Roseobacter sp. WL0113]MCV3273957.1 oligosaccharide flippase family protein [Roseobacter sp. WL0113]